METIEGFKNYLINVEGYKEFTPSGLPSTVYAYERSIFKVCDQENITLLELNDLIGLLCTQYDIGGIKEEQGNKSHRTVINALKAYKRYIEHGNACVAE